MSDQPWKRATPPAPTASASAFACPRCGSEQVQSLSLVHGAGSTSGRTAGGAVGMSVGGEMGYLSGSAIISSQSALARKAAPPREQAVDGLAGLAVLLLVGCAALGQALDHLIAGAVVGIAFFGFTWWRKVEGPDAWNRDEYPKLLERWRRTFMCMRCGDAFEVQPQHLRR